MAEVLGVVSAAAQLATLCCSLLRVMAKLKGAGLTLQNYQLQLQDLSLLSNSISRNPLLQTSEIGTLTQSLLSLIRQANLTFVLQKHRIIRTLYILCRERDLVETLTAVERQKLSLCLSIEQIQSDALFEIRASIQDMSYEMPNVKKKRVGTRIQARETSTSQSNGNNSNMKPAAAKNTTKGDETAKDDSPTAQVDSSDEDSSVSDSFDDESVVDSDSCTGSCAGRVEQTPTLHIKDNDVKNNPATRGSTAADGEIGHDTCAAEVDQVINDTALEKNPAPCGSTTATRETGPDSRAADVPQIANEEQVATEPLAPKDSPGISDVSSSGRATLFVGNKVEVSGHKVPLLEEVSKIRNVTKCGPGDSHIGSYVVYTGGSIPEKSEKLNVSVMMGSISGVTFEGDEDENSAAPAERRVGGVLQFRS
ncbi:hypothetical protein LMH87_000190 [Akanthomyces muscarius]|uniref:Uncharacterized protein n=1 Tax=Akanthomyces muscarius TaxID=2231603 RepID=A0A9W8QE20_AKAMU|nr:hypothetical protein LMH87_000190 [Akanthomyces muscarius]KAJ4154919.1 hypothetical protein LMH87_000190 [Akanthomyces muscarius]